MEKRLIILQWDYVNNTESRITFKIKTGYYYLELLTLQTMKLFESTKSKINRNKNGEMCLI